MRATLLVTFALAGCGRIGFGDVPRPGDASTGGADGTGTTDATPGPQPIHQYSLQGSYADDFGGVSIVGSGGGFTAGGYQFLPNQGLTLYAGLPPDVYTVDVEVSLSDLSSWRKLLDFDDLTQDTGFYIFDSALQYVIVPGSDFLTAAPTFVANTMTRITLTRDASQLVVAYLDGAPVMAQRASTSTPPGSPPSTPFAFTDSTQIAVVSAANNATFFIDDTVTAGGEASAGVVRRIRIYDVALTAAQVAAMP